MLRFHRPTGPCKECGMSALAWDRLLGRLARLPLRLIPSELAVPVLSGPDRSRR